jgi:hypothetical protein
VAQTGSISGCRQAAEQCDGAVEAGEPWLNGSKPCIFGSQNFTLESDVEFKFRSTNPWFLKKEWFFNFGFRAPKIMSISTNWVLCCGI